MREHHEGPERSLAAVALSGVALLSVLPALTLMAVLWDLRFGGLNVRTVAMAGFVSAAVVQAMSIAGLSLGVSEVERVRRAGRSRALGMAGAAMGIATIVAWTLIALQWWQEVTFFL